VHIADAPAAHGLSTTHRSAPARPRVAPPAHVAAHVGVAAKVAKLAIPHIPAPGAHPRSPLHRPVVPVVPKPVPELPPTRNVPSSGSGNPFPGSLAVLVAVAAAASLVATRLRSATTVWPSMLFATLIERPG
jgi:hypothetical protein